MTDRAAAIVDAPERQTIVWHVGVSTRDTMNRLQGAWVYHSDDDRINDLILGRVILATNAGHNAAKQAGGKAFLDPQATVDAIRSVIDDLQHVFEENLKTRKGTTLVPPSWPQLGDSTSPVAKADPPVEAALGAARWLAGIASGWEKVEHQRRIRPYLPGGSGLRPMPMVTE